MRWIPAVLTTCLSLFAVTTGWSPIPMVQAAQATSSRHEQLQESLALARETVRQAMVLLAKTDEYKAYTAALRAQQALERAIAIKDPAAPEPSPGQ